MISTYLKYGISSELAYKLENLDLPKTVFERLSNKILVNKFGLDIQEIKEIKRLIQRQPIEDDVVQALLENANFTCCICKGVKSDSYIIHHINPYSSSQDNQYYNLAVLCLNDHELAHKEGRSLTLKLTPEQILKAKTKWEHKVQDRNVYKASVNGDINEIEFLNVPRILELYKEILKKTPKTTYSLELTRNGLIREDGYINANRIADLAQNPSTPLIFFALYGSTMLRFHFFELFKELLTYLNFEDLDTLLNKKSIKEGVLGKYCFYVGGLYSSRLPHPINEETEMMTFHFRRRRFQVEWLVDPHYFASSSAKHRTFHRNVYLVYGKIMNVGLKKIDGKDNITINIRPYCFGLPMEQKYRIPDVAYQKRFDDIFDEMEDEDFEEDSA